VTDLAILLPVLRRPHRVEPVLESIAAATPDAHVVFLCDHDDFEMQGAVCDAGAEMHAFEKANYARKINEGVRLTDEPMLFFGADDLAFHPGWFERARRWIDKGFGVVSTNDLGNDRVARGELAVHPLVARWYAESETIDGSPGPLHEGYVHEFIDREFSEVARARKAFVYEPQAVVEHLHPFWGKSWAWGKEETARLFRLYQPRFIKGRRLYAKRHSMWKSRL
jgi:glycosyltransferase involved in cell wall biosynthesis